MGYPGYYLADQSPIEIVTFPKAERPGSTTEGRRGGPLSTERTNIELETEEGVLWIYPQVERNVFRLVFRVSEEELEIFETLDLAVSGNRVPFYFVVDVDASPLVTFLVRKQRDFIPPQLSTPHWDGTDIIPYYDYVLEMREESEAAQILA